MGSKTMTRMLAVLTALSLTVAAGATGAQAAGMKKLTVAFGFAASYTLPLWVAQDQGLFKKNGLDVRLIFFRGSAAATQAILGGSADIAFGSGSAAVTVVGRGAPVAIIATTALINYELVSRPNITSASQLRGKSVGISGFAGSDYFALLRLLPKLGLKPGVDVKFVVLGTPNSFKKSEAVLNGTTDATLSNFEVIANLRLAGKNVSVLGSLLDNGIKTSIGDVFVTRPYLAKHEATVKSFLRAFVEAIRMSKNDKALVFATLRKHTHTTKAAILEEVYQKRVLDRFQDKPYPIVDAVITARDDLAKATPSLKKLKSMPASKFIDDGPLNALEKEGFFKTLPPLKPQ